MSTMDAAAVQEAYSRWAKVYDATFGTLMAGARRRALRLLDLQVGEDAIEVGVGTGMSLPLIPAGCRFTGVDFSRPMLEKARAKLCSGKVVCDAALVEADGARLPFADATFDAAIAPFVVSAAPRPVELLRDMVRVCRPGARLVVMNHFTPRSPMLAKIEHGLSGLTSSFLGFQADFPLEGLFERAGLEFDSVQRVTPVGSWYAVMITRRENDPD